MPTMPSLTNWPIYSLKSGLAAGLALLLSNHFGVLDPVSAAFVAVVCTTPTVRSGLKAAFQQAIGSLLGGALALAFLALGIEGALALAVSVGLSVWITGALRMGDAHVVAAFTALLVVILGHSSPAASFEARVLAVGLGAGAALLSNVVLSAFQYRTLFRRRIGLARRGVADALDDGSTSALDAAELLLLTLNGELTDARGERWIGQGLARTLEDHLAEVQDLRRLIHHVRTGALQGDPATRATGRAAALTVRGDAEPPSDPGPIGDALRRWAERVRREDGSLPRIEAFAPSGWLTWG